MAYINHGNGPALLAVNLVALIVTFFLCSLRMYVRCFVVIIWKIEDWFFLAAEVLFLTFGVCSILAAVYGNGQRLVDINLKDLPLAMKFWYSCELLTILQVACTRISIGFFLLRIASVKKPLQYTIYTGMAVTVVVTIFYFFFSVFQCTPVSYFWLQFSGFKGKCIAAAVVQHTAIGSNTVGAVVDMAFGILPIFLIWNLQMNTRAKIAAISLLSLGTIAGATVFIRIYYIHLVSLSEDFLFATSKVAIWGVIEPALGLCCTAASTLRPLFKYFQEKSLRSGSKPTGYAGNTGQNSKSHFRSKKSMLGSSRSGYIKSSDDGNEYGDGILLDTVIFKGNSTAEASDEENGSVQTGKGIYRATKVEISRSDRFDNTS